jgi:hypothetical protein
MRDYTRGMAQLRGTFRALLLYDISEEIRLEVARALLGAAPPERRPEFRGPAPEYVRFEHPPIVYSCGEARLPGGDAWSGVIKLYGYGVMSVVLELPFEGDWDEVVRLASRWMGSPDIERCAIDLARSQIGRIQRALVKPYKDWTMEDYYAVHVRSAPGASGGELSAADLLAQFGGRVAQMVRGESVTLSDSEISRVLEEWVSYYPADLLVVAWMAAFVYDTPEGAAPILQLLEYANTQLLEFRHYDDLLTKVLADVYSSLERRRGVLRRWRIGAEAERLNRIRLEVTELTERIDNSIKFLSDMFYARAYRLAARRIGVTDYRELVDGKLKTAGDLYQSMVEEFHQARTFVLELMVVAILIIELVFLFRGKP